MKIGLKHIAYAVLALGLVGGWYSMRVKQVMHTRSRYTIGYLTGAIYTPKSGKRYSYKYTVMNKTYEATDGREKDMNTANGTRFLVEYDTLDPGVSTGHFTTFIPDSILDSPSNGWEKSSIPLLKPLAD